MRQRVLRVISMFRSSPRAVEDCIATEEKYQVIGAMENKSIRSETIIREEKQSYELEEKSCSWKLRR